MPGPNFELITELQTLIRRDFPLATEALLNPFNANPLIDGEYLQLDTNYKLARGSSEGASALVFPIHTERGRYDTQAIGKTSVLYLGQYEAETVVCDVTALSLGDMLTVQDVTVGALTRRGLKKKVAASGVAVVGFVSKLYAGQTKVRFLHMATVIG